MSDALRRRLAAWSEQAPDVVGQLADGPAKPALVRAVRSFGEGLRAALDGRADVSSTARPAIATEGLGMGAALLDALRPLPEPRLAALLAGPRPDFVALGAGMAYARLGRDDLPDALGARAAVGRDGWGYLRALLEPHRLRGAVRLGVPEPAAWVGAGRALWFLTAGDPDAILARLERCDPGPRPHVFEGVGVACAFAGGAPEAVAEALRGRCADGAFDAGHARGRRALTPRARERRAPSRR